MERSGNVTLPHERKIALKNVKEWFMHLLMKKGPIRKSDLKHAYRSAFKHYPADFQIDEFWKEKGCDDTP